MVAKDETKNEITLPNLEQFLKQAITDRGQWLTNIISV